jgi:hypothetical protein
MDKKIDQFEQSIDDLIAEISNALPLSSRYPGDKNHNKNILITGVAR